MIIIEMLAWAVGMILLYTALWITIAVLVGIGAGIEQEVRKLGKRSEDRRRARRIIGEYRGW